MARNIKELETIGIEMTPELAFRVMEEVKARLLGFKDGVLHEPLDQIVINKFTAMDLSRQLEEVED